MSVWHALDGQDVSAEAHAGIEITRWPRRQLSLSGTSISDALSDPKADVLTDQHVQYLPPGAAFGTPDNLPLVRETLHWNFWRGLGDAFAQLYRTAWLAMMESTALTINASLEDWETEYGLPDPCMPHAQTIEQRLRYLQLKVRAVASITPGDYLNLAAELGIPLLIEEPVFFECGASDCGGADELGGPPAEHLVVFWPIDVSEWIFETGVSELGSDILYDFTDSAVLECVFSKILPAGFSPVFSYSYNSELAIL